MNKRIVANIGAALAVLGAAGLFFASLKLPLWHLKMEAPQYQGEEALRVHVYPGRMSGDLEEIKVLNQYVGVHLPKTLPQFRWLPIALLTAAGVGLFAIGLSRRLRWRALLLVASLLTATMLGSAAMAQWQMHQIGHARDPHTALKGVEDFTPLLLGRVKVANFEITSTLGTGSFLIIAGIALQIGAGLWCRRSLRPARASAAQESTGWHVPARSPAA